MQNYLPNVSDRELVQLQKPAQYLGGERNSITKEDSEVDVHFALAFPDTYEVGMSHIGIQILYQIINEDPKAWAERVYMPLADMESVLREKRAPLTSLEAKRPLTEFDIVGFSLQYELCATNILAMLELGQIPFEAQSRDASHPIILGGGPYAYHPEAVAPFFDAFFIGDAEEGILELVEAIRAWKQSENPLSRAKFVSSLSSIEGVYVPSNFIPHYAEDGSLQEIVPNPNQSPEVRRRLLPTLEGAPYASRPIVPNIKTVHNRLSIEVMRGCVRGCRFCQAGYLYRPQRERPPEEIMEMISQSLPETGFEELSLLSLSTADYCSIVPLLKSVMDKYATEDQLAVSFPSTRVDSLTPEVLEQVQRVRRTGFTVAPEAGTQRLRDVINKGVSDEEILKTSKNVFRMGWTGIKLYFMIGLPTETDVDLQGIIDTAASIKKLPEAKGKKITVSVSTHVPKPHTPFQWAEQITVAETIRRQRFLAQGLKQVGVNFRYHDAFSSFLEGVFCRGDRDLSQVLLRAYKLGSRLDAWVEHVNEDIWNQAFLDSDIDPNYYLRERAVEEALPWDHLSCDIPKSYFAKEYRRALRDKETPDCLTQSCSVCKACDYDSRKNVLWPRHETEELLRSEGEEKKATAVILKDPLKDPVQRLRVSYQKSGAYRFVGHLELVQVIQRATRRAQIPVAHTKGFHPMFRMAFGPPLPLGAESFEELFDIYLITRMTPETLKYRLKETFPEGLSITSIAEVPLRAPSIQAELQAQEYRVSWLGKPSGVIGELLQAKNSEELKKQVHALKISRKQKNKSKKRRRTREKTLFFKDHIQDISFGESESPSETPDLEFTLRFDGSNINLKPSEVIETLSELGIGEYLLQKTKSHVRA